MSIDACAQRSAALGAPATFALGAAEAVILVLGGMVKGLLGVRVLLVAVPLLSLLVPVSKAVRLVAVPVLASNA